MHRVEPSYRHNPRRATEPRGAGVCAWTSPLRRAWHKLARICDAYSRHRKLVVSDTITTARIVREATQRELTMTSYDRSAVRPDTPSFVAITSLVIRIAKLAAALARVGDHCTLNRDTRCRIDDSKYGVDMYSRASERWYTAGSRTAGDRSTAARRSWRLTMKIVHLPRVFLCSYALSLALVSGGAGCVIGEAPAQDEALVSADITFTPGAAYTLVGVQSNKCIGVANAASGTRLDLER